MTYPIQASMPHPSKHPSVTQPINLIAHSSMEETTHPVTTDLDLGQIIYRYIIYRYIV